MVASSKSRQEEAGGQPAATSAVRAAILPALCSVDYRQAVRRSQRAADVVRLCLMPRRNDRARQLHTEEECDGKTSTRRRISNRVARPPSSDERLAARFVGTEVEFGSDRDEFALASTHVSCRLFTLILISMTFS